MSEFHKEQVENKTENEDQKDEDQKGEENDSVQSFTEALREKYCFDGTDYTFGSCQITFHGKAGTGGAKAELAHLRNVVLCNANLAFAGIPSGGLASLCPNVIDLDISGNNLISWKEIVPIFQELTHLKFVNLGGNPIHTDQEYLEAIDKPISNVENLVLNGTFISCENVLKLAKRLPALKEIHVCYNDYEEFCEMEEEDLENVECFRANNNNIQKWSEVWKLRHIPKLRSLILSGNPVKDIFFDHKCCAADQENGEESMKVCDLNCASHNNCDNTLTESGDPNLNCDFPETSESLSDAENDNPDNCQKLSRDQNSDGELNQMSTDLPTLVYDGTACNPQAELEKEFYTMVTELLKEAAKMADQELPPLKGTNRFRYDSLQSEDGDYDDYPKLISPEAFEQRVAESTEQMPSETSGHIPAEMMEKIPPEALEQMSAEASRPIPPEELQQVPSGTTRQMEPQVSEQTSSTELNEAANDEPVCQPFQNLHTLCLTETDIHHTDHLEALTKFPSLKSVRLRDVPLYKEHNDEESWKLFLASLPNIELFNGSEISAMDRENSERFYLRYYLDFEDKPRRHEELEQKHGKLKRIVDIDISGNYQKYAMLQFYINNKKSFTRRLCMRDSVDRLRTLVATELKTSKRGFRLFHFPCGPDHVYENGEFPEREKLVANLPLSRFNMRDGDEIHVETASTLQDMDVRVVICESRWQSRVPKD